MVKKLYTDHAFPWGDQENDLLVEALIRKILVMPTGKRLIVVVQVIMEYGADH